MATQFLNVRETRVTPKMFVAGTKMSIFWRSSGVSRTALHASPGAFRTADWMCSPFFYGPVSYCFSFPRDAVTHLLCRKNCLIDSDDGHDSIQALSRRGDIEECVLADDGFGDPFSGNSNRSVHACHVEQKRRRCNKGVVAWNVLSRCPVKEECKKTG